MEEKLSIVIMSILGTVLAFVIAWQITETFIKPTVKRIINNLK